jgi:hypothetical protein
MDAAGNESTASNTVSLTVDSILPTVSSVAITGATGIANNTLNAGDVVTVTVTLSEAVAVTGTPKLGLTVGSAVVQANYVAAGSTATQLKFNYTILANQTDANGIAIAANSLSLNGATILDLAGNSTTLTHLAVSDNAGYLVDTTPPTAPTGLADSAIVGGYVRSTTQTLTANAQTGTTVNVYDTNGTTLLGSAVAVNGAASVTVAGLTQGAHTLSA